MQWNGRNVTGSGRALLRSTSAALTCRNTRTREARNVFGRGGLLGDGTRTGYLPHVRCYNIQWGRPHTYARTHALHTHMHKHARAHTRTHTHTHIYIYIYIFTLVRTHKPYAHAYTHYARADTHTHARFVCLKKRGLHSISFFFRRLLTIPRIFLVFLITRCIYWSPTLK